ncbi:MAG TPA: DUF4214 domain-containing protein, partial [Planctomycetia bacterium]|nr:DUF4214 domain-containing protein [Planctomycetia bacterium]
IKLTGGEMVVSDALHIEGIGTNQVTISGENKSRIFNIETAAGTQVSMRGLALERGSGGIGGAIRNRDANFYITESTIKGSQAAIGGAIANEGTGIAFISASTLQGNHSTQDGGAVYSSGAGVDISTSRITGNGAGGNGGGVAIRGGALGMDRSTLDGNATSGAGGGVLLAGTSASEIRSTTVSGNIAEEGGAGIDAHSALTLRNDTIAGNNDRKTTGGGGLRIESGTTVALQNTIVGENVSGGHGADILGTVASAGNNLVSDREGANGFHSSDILDVLPRLDGLFDNGGPTPTRLLLSESPAIGKGAKLTDIAIDQRGYSRELGARTDIGATTFDTVSPTAVLSAANNITQAQQNAPLLFSVTYSDDLALRLATFGNDDILVTGPNGFSAYAKAYGVDANADGPIRTVGYYVAVPEGGWQPVHNGTYALTMNSSGVTDPQGNPVAAGTLGTFTVQVEATPGFVRALYLSLLGRDADEAGLKSYQDRLNAGESRTAIVQDLWESKEHRERQVEQIYQSLLGREASTEDRDYWVGYMMDGRDEEDITATFLASDEYRTQHPDAEAYVGSLYQAILGRTGTATETADYAAQVGSGTGDFEKVAKSIMKSEEGRAAFLNSVYEFYLKRAADESAAGYLTTPKHGDPANTTALTIEILASNEFFTLSGDRV